MNDFGMFSDDEVLAITKDIARKVWTTALIVGLMDQGRIGRAAAIEIYGCGVENLAKIRRRYKREQRALVKEFYRTHEPPSKINAQLEFFLE